MRPFMYILGTFGAYSVSLELELMCIASRAVSLIS